MTGFQPSNLVAISAFHSLLVTVFLLFIWHGRKTIENHSKQDNIIFGLLCFFTLLSWGITLSIILQF